MTTLLQSISKFFTKSQETPVNRADKAPEHGPTCSVCLEDYEAKPEGWVELEKCAHVFHEACILPWVQQGGTTCPICRKELGTLVLVYPYKPQGEPEVRDDHIMKISAIGAVTLAALSIHSKRKLSGGGEGVRPQDVIALSIGAAGVVLVYSTFNSVKRSLLKSKLYL